MSCSSVLTGFSGWGMDQDPTKAQLAWHGSVMVLSFAGLALVAGVCIALRFRFYPAAGKYLTTIGDLVLVTAVGLAGQRTESGIVVVYVLIIATTYLRFSAPLVITATVGSVIGYLTLVGAADSTWFDAEHVTPVDRQLVTLFTIVLTGVVGWFICNTARVWFETQEELRQESAGPTTPTERRSCHERGSESRSQVWRVQ